MTARLTRRAGRAGSVRHWRVPRRVMGCLVLMAVCSVCCSVAATLSRSAPVCLADSQRRTQSLFARFAQSSAPVELYPLQTAPPYTVALDAGHGGFDTGAQAMLDEVRVCEATVDALFALLSQDPNYAPLRTRESGQDLSTKERAEVAIAARASLFLSVHANCDKSTGQSHGFECFPTPPGRTYSEQSLRFATLLVQGMQDAGHRIRGENGVRFAYYSGHNKQIVESTNTKPRTQKSFGVVEKPQCPSVLVEQCFLTNASDVEKWASPDGCRTAARVYYEAICAYFGTEPIPAA